MGSGLRDVAAKGALMKNHTQKTAADSYAKHIGNNLAAGFTTLSGTARGVAGLLGNAATGAINFGREVAGGGSEYDARSAAVNAAAHDDLKRRLGEALLALGAGGAGLGIAGTKLHQMLGGMNKPTAKHTKFIPGAHAPDDDEKLAEAAAAPVNPAKTIGYQIGNTLLAGTAPNTINPDNPNARLNFSQEELGRIAPAVLLAGVLSTYGGYKLTNSLYQNKHKAQLEDEVSSAKKDYERALTGKRAEVLDRAFEKKADLTTTLLTAPYKALTYIPSAAPAYMTALAAAGLLSGKMTYDWTRERSQDKALERARRSRARLAGNVPLYIDPDQLAAVKKLAG